MRCGSDIVCICLRAAAHWRLHTLAGAPALVLGGMQDRSHGSKAHVRCTGHDITMALRCMHDYGFATAKASMHQLEGYPQARKQLLRKDFMRRSGPTWPQTPYDCEWHNASSEPTGCQVKEHACNGRELLKHTHQVHRVNRRNHSVEQSMPTHTHTPAKPLQQASQRDPHSQLQHRRKAELPCLHTHPTASRRLRWPPNTSIQHRSACPAYARSPARSDSTSHPAVRAVPAAASPSAQMLPLSAAEVSTHIAAVPSA